MSSRLGQTISRYNAALGNHPTLDISGIGGVQQQGQVSSDNSGNSVPSSAHVMAHQPPPSHYKGHRGHKRGHSYGGVVSPPTSGIHHSQLEPRTSHPNTHHGVLLPSHGSSSLQKGHRRALSGCLPSAVGAMAWASLRDLDTAAIPLGSNFPANQPIRGLTTADSRPSSPSGIVTIDSKGTLKSAISHTLEKKSLEVKIIPKKKQDLECGPCVLPKCFQGRAHIQFFVCILATLVTLQQAVSSGYVNSVITTIEARFEIPSRYSGLIASSYEMGNVVTVLFVSYLGARRRITIISCGVLVMVVGCIVFTLPHFLSPDHNGGIMGGRGSTDLKRQQTNSDSYTLTDRLNSRHNIEAALADLANNNASSLPFYGVGNGDSNGTSLRQGRNSICHSVNPQSSPFIHRSNSDLLENSAEGDSKVQSVRKQMMSVGCSSVEVIDKDGTKTTQPTEESYGHPLILFMLAQLLLGCGGSPLFTLGVTYVDDHVPAESSSVYIGIIYAMAAFGPVLGFLVGAWLLSIPSSSSHLQNPDAKIIGLWWGGFLIAGGLLFVAALPFLTFPRVVSSKKDEDETSTAEPDALPPLEQEQCVAESKEPKDGATGQESEGYGQSIKDIPRSIWRLITNPTYVLTCLGGCMELNIVSGFVVFLPKYLETQFSLGKSEASLFTGGIAIPGACFGIFFGGWLVKRMQMKPSGACKFVVTTNIICLAGYVLFFFLGCSNPNLAGATVPYPAAAGVPISTTYAPLNINLTNSCNSDCSCDSSLDAQYVCHEGVTYFSPCHAGCAVNLTQCSCAGGGNATPGPCQDKPCNTLLPFMIVLFFMTATVAVTQMPLLMIVLRSVEQEERSFALGMQFVIFRLLGYIPSPIVFGNVIDSACLLWSIKRCSIILPAVSGRCLLYDVEDFRYKYVGMLSGLKLLALALFLYDLYFTRKVEKEKEEIEAAAEDKMKCSSSIISLDKLFHDDDTGSVTTIITTTTTITPACPQPSFSQMQIETVEGID